MRKLIKVTERKPSKNGLYFSLDDRSFVSICLFENGKWYILNSKYNECYWWWPFSAKKKSEDINKVEINNPDFYWLEE